MSRKPSRLLNRLSAAHRDIADEASRDYYLKCTVKDVNESWLSFLDSRDFGPDPDDVALERDRLKLTERRCLRDSLVLPAPRSTPRMWSRSNRSE